MADDGNPPVDPNQTPPADPPADPPARTFTQEDVDRIVQDRLARAKTQPPADYEDLKAAAKKLQELEEADRTELEKTMAKLEKAEKRAADIEAAANKRLIEAAVLAEAARQNAVKPEHLHKLIDTDAVTVGDDGQVTGVQEAVKAFLDANPEYVGTRATGSADQGARAGGVKQLTREALASMSPEEIVVARREGRTAKLEGRL
jgi:hypothetical protein